MNLVDTSGWVEYFFDGPNAAHFAVPIEEPSSCVVSVICLYEVFKKVRQTGDEAGALRAVAQMKEGRVVPVSEEIALSAAVISVRHGLPMADSLIYAAAQIEKARVWTQDEHFRDLPDVSFVPAKMAHSGRRAKKRS